MGVLGDGSGWCFCSGGGAKLERIKSTLLAAKGPAVAALSFSRGGEGGLGGGKRGDGFLIHRGLLLTTHGTVPSAAAAGAAEVRLSQGRLLARPGRRRPRRSTTTAARSRSTTAPAPAPGPAPLLTQIDSGSF